MTFLIHIPTTRESPFPGEGYLQLRSVKSGQDYYYFFPLIPLSKDYFFQKLVSQIILAFIELVSSRFGAALRIGEKRTDVQRLK